MLRFSNTKLSMPYNLLSAGVALWVILVELLDKKTVQGWSVALRTECGFTHVTCPLQFSHAFAILMYVCNFHVPPYGSFMDVCNSHMRLQFSSAFAILILGSPNNNDGNRQQWEWKQSNCYFNDNSLTGLMPALWCCAVERTQYDKILLIYVFLNYECYSNGTLLERMWGGDVLLSKQDWPKIWWLGMLGETGWQEMIPIRGYGDFLAYGSPRISAHPCQMLGFKARGRRAGDLSVCT